MFLILKTTDWKEEDYIKSGIVPFGWYEDELHEVGKYYDIVQFFKYCLEFDQVSDFINEIYKPNL